MKKFKVYFKNTAAILAINAKSAELVPQEVLKKAGTGLIIDSVVEVK